MWRLLAIIGILAALALAACGTDEDDPAAKTSAATAAEDGDSSADDKTGGAETGKPDTTGTEIIAAESQYGSILFDSKQQAIYLFDKELSGARECYDACAEAWPPVLTDADPRVGAGVEAKLLGTTERDDGSTQVTYAGHPLYYYIDDPPGEVLCQNVEEFGGTWLVVEPGGDPA
jgi:predicted lipoprotein with Yx(FWY)xxD motif